MKPSEIIGKKYRERMSKERDDTYRLDQWLFSIEEYLDEEYEKNSNHRNSGIENTYPLHRGEPR